MSKPIQLGISTCPNDTFAFHAILKNKIDLDGLKFDIDLTDVQELNESLLAGRYDVAKASFHAALLCADETVVLRSGSALGFGVGPVLLSHQKQLTPQQFAQQVATPKILCPGATTTATLLLNLFHGNRIQSELNQGEQKPAGKVSDTKTTNAMLGHGFDIEQVVFSDIMPRLQSKSADFGVCIHEGRFSYREHQLHVIEDLGQTWESTTACPLPLGGILARRELGNDTISKIQNVITRSIEYGLEHREETAETMKSYAQEFDDEILFAHVDLYVNEWTRDLGTVGRQALLRLNQIAKESGLIPLDATEIEVAS